MNYIACQATLFMGFSGQEYWSGLPFPSLRDLPEPGVEPGSPALKADSVLSEPPRTCLPSMRHNRLEFSPWVGKIPWRRAWQPTPVFLRRWILLILENSTDRGADRQRMWQATSIGHMSWTQLKRLSMQVQTIPWNLWCVSMYVSVLVCVLGLVKW